MILLSYLFLLSFTFGSFTRAFNRFFFIVNNEHMTNTSLNYRITEEMKYTFSVCLCFTNIREKVCCFLLLSTNGKFFWKTELIPGWWRNPSGLFYWVLKFNRFKFLSLSRLVYRIFFLIHVLLDEGRRQAKFKADGVLWKRKDIYRKKKKRKERDQYQQNQNKNILHFYVPILKWERETEAEEKYSWTHWQRQ